MNFGEVKSTFDRMDADLERIGEEVVATKSWRESLDGKLSGVGSAIQQFGEAVESLNDRVEEMEAGVRTPGKGGTPAGGGRKTLADVMHADEGFKAFLAGKSGGNFSLELPKRSLLTQYKAELVSNLYGGSPSTTIPVQALRQTGFANNPQRRLRILDILPHQSLSGTNAFEWLKLEDGYSPSAAVQAQEGDGKAEAQIPCSLQNGQVFTIANYVNVSVQLLSDLPSLQRILENLLTYACLLQLESQVITGSSSAVTGLLEVAPTAMTNTKTSRADKIGEAAAVLAMAGWNPNVVLLNPLDEFEIESEKATGGDEQYVSPPTGGKFWRLTPVATPTIAQGTALVFDSSQATIYDRETINILIGTVNDQFTRNMRTLLVEGRFGFAFAAPNAVKRVAL